MPSRLRHACRNFPRHVILIAIGVAIGGALTYWATVHSMSPSGAASTSPDGEFRVDVVESTTHAGGQVYAVATLYRRNRRTTIENNGAQWSEIAKHNCYLDETGMEYYSIVWERDEQRATAVTVVGGSGGRARALHQWDLLAVE